MAARPGVGHNPEVPRRVALSLSLVLAGCLDFGGPLINHDESDSEGGSDSTGGSECGPTTAMVDRAIDGDTIVLTTGEHVRLILVDTTEITNDKNECWGQNALQFTKGMVEGREVVLDYDVECLDQYGRLLAYVSVDGVEVNRALLEQGQACLAYFPPNGETRVFEYQGYETAAKQAGLAMWGACDPVPCD
ncbi:thermonuclease family protein [Nannocystaceae bacterium ST9]